MSANPILDPTFSRNLKRYLNGLAPHVKREPRKCTHAIKTFLVQHGLSEDAVGWANQIKMALARFVDKEWMWDVVGRVPSAQNPMEYIDLTFVAESENAPQLNKIMEDAAKLPIVRTDVRLMFFRANDRECLETFFRELGRFFKSHRRTEPGDLYILAGQDLATATFYVRRLTIPHERANAREWEEVQ